MKSRHCSNIFQLLFLYFTLTSVLLQPADAQQPSFSSTSNGDNYAVQRSKVSPLLAVILIVLVFVFSIVGCSALFVCSGNSSIGAPLPTTGNAQLTTAVQRGLDQSVLDACPTFLYSAVKELKIGKGTLDCAVCLNEFKEDETLRLLPVCDHVFHSECVDTWLSAHTTCPVCRACLVPESTNDDSEFHSDDPSEDNGLEIMVTVTPFPPKVPKSHSTGHSLVRASQDRERFTLRLPDEVRKQLLVARPRLKRTTSTVVLPRVLSSRRGYRSGGEGGGSSRYGRFFGRSFRWSMKNNGGDEDASMSSKRFFGTVVTPFNAVP